MNITRELLQGLKDISDDERNALISIYDGAKAKDEEIEKLRQKQPTDSQTVVEKLEFSKLQNSLKERELLVEELRKKMESISGTTVIDPLAAFFPIAELFKEGE